MIANPRTWQQVFFRILIAGSIFFLLITALLPNGLPFTGRLSFLHHTRWQLNLTGENNVAAWWSGMLLLLAAVYALDACVAHRKDERRQFIGWGGLALLLTLLSMDEIGSVHERIPKIILVVVGLMLAAVGSFALFSLLRSRVPFPHVLLIALAFLLFASVAGQEYLQFTTNWWGTNTGLRAGLEEGCELVAMLLLVWVTGFHAALSSGQRAPFRGLAVIRPAAVGVAIALAFVTAPIAASLDDPHRGNPAMWVASATFLLTALGFLGRGLDEGNFPNRRLVLLISSLAASIVCVAFPPPLGTGPQTMRLALSHAAFMLPVAVLLTAMWWRTQLSHREGRWLLGLAALLWLSMPLSPTAWTGLGYGLIAACMLRVSGYAPAAAPVPLAARRAARTGSG